MTERAAHILQAVVQEYIDSGDPVSSGHLYRRYDFDIKPAMIRAELAELADAGYLVQPYPSAGRVPTDKAYRFFARAFVERSEGPAKRSPEEVRKLAKEDEWPDVVRELSHELGTSNVAAHRTGKFFFKEGLSELIAHLEWESRQMLRDVVRDFESIDKTCVKDLPSGKDIQVFIGKRSPVTRSPALSVMIGEYAGGSMEDRVVLMLVGPKRMDYRKAIKTLRGLISN